VIGLEESEAGEGANVGAQVGELEFAFVVI